MHARLALANMTTHCRRHTAGTRPLPLQPIACCLGNTWLRWLSMATCWASRGTGWGSHASVGVWVTQVQWRRHSESAEVDPPTFTKLCANTPRRKPHCKAHIIQHACVPMKARRLGVNGQSWHSDADTSQAAHHHLLDAIHVTSYVTQSGYHRPHSQTQASIRVTRTEASDSTSATRSKLCTTSQRGTKDRYVV